MAKKSTYKFKTEVQQLLNLIINSLYSNQEIFLREIISNASDALDRLRFKAQTDSTLLADDPEFKITITPDKTAHTLRISDNGIGMTREEVIENIGTIAHSGTEEFLKVLEHNKEATAPELIGQFGVGFYSAFMVAENVTIITRAAGSDEAYKWESSGDGSYSIQETEKGSRGTDIIIKLKDPGEDGDDYTDEWRIRSIVKKHSDFISYPICMYVEKTEPVKDEKGKEVEILDKNGNKIPKTEKRTVEETLNSMKAIWTMSKDEVTDEEYNEFYKHLTHDFADPQERLHLKLEGTLEYYALLYIPSTPPMDFFSREQKHGIDLYSKRVFIMHECEDLIPEYLRFVKGVVDSSDLNLNVSREILQQNQIVKNIRKNLVKKMLELLDKMDNERYEEFYEHFGAILKEGVHTDWSNREKIADLLRYKTTKSDGKRISLKQYIDNMKPDQKEIYYLIGENISTIMNSPALEQLKEKDYEVLLMTDFVDEWVAQSLPEYKEKKLRSAEKGDLDIEKIDEDKKKSLSEFFEHIKSLLGDKVKDVKPSTRLKDSVACLAGDQYDMGSYMEKILKATGKDAGNPKRILELNMDHPVVERLDAAFQENRTDERVEEYVRLIYDLAVISEGGKIDDPGKFSKMMGNLMAESL